MEPGTSETRLGSSPSRPISLAALTPGTMLADRYRIVALVGHGGMGEVYRADDLRLGQPVALKFLSPDLEDNPFARERLLAEVRSARTVSHPNVCRVYDVGEAHGRVFLTMEYIDGEDLASLLRRIGRLPPSKALEVARQLCAGLAAAHERGVLHRDLKPANVMIDGRGQARITDFGLAVEVPEVGDGVPRVAARGVVDVAGTMAYMAPERFEGAAATVQSDLYALGLVLYEVYTGKPAVSAATVDGWRRAHSDSTPSHPSAIVAEIEPAVERAILRCLEKDPALRPHSAAQLAAALPGGDPLAAAVAAGETPSPELVAASGEEGTLPRAQAWTWFGICLAALALAVLLGSQWQLVNLPSLNEPAVQRATARQILASLGYRDAPGDSASYYSADRDYLTNLVATRPAKDWFTEPAQGPDALFFAYRQSARALFTWNPFGNVSSVNPPPDSADDVYLRLDGRGRLVSLRVGGLAFRRSEPASEHPMDWSRLFAAAGLDPATFTETTVEWPPIFAADESRAWQGRVGGNAVRVEASAYRGRPVQFVATRADARPTLQAAPTSYVLGALDLLATITTFGTVLVLGLLARHNVRAGRGDTKRAWRLALTVFAVEATYVVLYRHWTFEPLNMVVVFIYLLGPAFFTAAATWLFYVGAEPFLRRRWPHLLVAWTRFLDGRWRDPLVGRSLLTGAVAALVAVGIVPGFLSVLGRAYSLPLAVPRFSNQSLSGSLGWFLAYDLSAWPAPVHALELTAVVLIARLALRRDRLAWIALLLVTFGLHAWETSVYQPWSTAAPLATALAAGTLATALVTVLARTGLLAGVTCYAVAIALAETPLTYNLAHWYAWRTGVVVVLVAGLAFWGFRNVLGRQSAFPAGALDQ